MNILDYASVSPESWDLLCEHSDDAWLFHRYHWIAIEEKYFTAQNFSFAIMDSDEEVVAILPIYFLKYGFERLLVSGFPRQTGLATLNGIGNIKLNKIRSLVMKRVFELAEKLDVDRIQLSISSLAPSQLSKFRNLIPFWVLDYSFQHGTNVGPNGVLSLPGITTCVADQIIDITKSEEELYQEMVDSCRRNIKKSKKNDLCFSECNSTIDVKTFYYLAQKSAERTSETIAPFNYYQDLLYFKDNFKLFLAFFHDEPIAGLILALDKDSASFLSGVSEPGHLHLRPNDFIHWSAILWLKRNNYKHYRLGPYFPNLPKDWPVAKVSFFKSKFGGQSYVINEGSYFRKPEKYYNLCQEYSAKLCNIQRSQDTAVHPVQNETYFSTYSKFLNLIKRFFGMVEPSSI